MGNILKLLKYRERKTECASLKNLIGNNRYFGRDIKCQNLPTADEKSEMETT